MRAERKAWKSVLLVVVMVAGFSIKTSAQYFDGGIIGGLSASQIDGDSFAGYKKVGLLGGAWVRRMFSYTVGQGTDRQSG